MHVNVCFQKSVSDKLQFCGVETPGCGVLSYSHLHTCFISKYFMYQHTGFDCYNYGCNMCIYFTIQ
jgi:hypothetical protein